MFLLIASSQAVFVSTFFMFSPASLKKADIESFVISDMYSKISDKGSFVNLILFSITLLADKKLCSSLTL